MATSPKSMKTTRTQSSIPPIIVKSTFVCRTKKRFKEHWEIFRTKENIKNSQIKMTIISTNYLSNLEGKDGEREDDDSGDSCRDDHCVRVVLHAHLFPEKVEEWKQKNVELPPKKAHYLELPLPSSITI